MPYGTLFIELVIATYRALRHIPFDNGNQLFRPSGMDGTGIRRNDSVAVLGIKTDDGISVLVHPHGDLQFISITVRQIASHRIRNGNVDTADFTQGISNDSGFVAKLSAVI